ncbi:MAG: carboxy terminal-processing peptidase [Flavobacteriales bacterium]|nr:carboxy terminal-processing peptidase [Flavobacteriales bacterium]
MYYPSVLILLLLASNAIALDKERTTCEKALMITKTAAKYHYNPREVDDAFSAFVFDDVFATIDQEKLIFAKEDYDALLNFKTRIDEDILAEKCEFVKAVARRFASNLQFADSVLKNIGEDKIDLLKKDSITFLRDDTFSNRADLEGKWIRWLKLEMLRTYYRQNDSVPDLKPPDKGELKKLLDQVKERESCRIESILAYEGEIEYYVDQVYLTSISLAYDPHSMYFSQSTKHYFNMSLSKETASFGIEVGRNEFGQIEVTGMIPGGPAWNSNAFNEGDIILSVEANGITTAFVCVEWSEVDYFLQGEDIDKVTFHIQKMNGNLVTVKLVKEVINVEQNVIQSFLLSGTKKIGYIYVPSFYTEMNAVDYLSNGCANDVAKELIKLKREGIDGLVLDLRNNGGGSMLEAVRLCGIFIDYGSVAIYDDRLNAPQTLKDMNRGLVFSDPIIILINGYSASASEFFAAAMQDQNRAIIVGSRSYGKSTSQTIIPLDSYMYEKPSDSRNKSGDFIKLTMGQFFRVTGKSHQKEGIIPDIALPDSYDKVEFGESIYDNALKATSITKKTYFYPSEALPIAALKAKSQIRVDGNAKFDQVKSIAITVAEMETSYTMPLEFNAFMANREERSHRHEELATVADAPFSVNNPSYMKGISSFSDSNLEINEELMKSIKNDLYIRESFLIINDLLSLTK